MSKTATLNVTLSVTGDGVNEQSIPLASFQSTNSPGYRFLLRLANGDNNLATILPALPAPLVESYLIVVLPAGSVVTVKGAGGDAGVSLAPGLLMFAPGGGNPILTSTGTCVVTIWVL